jgi:hypothetical protein
MGRELLVQRVFGGKGFNEEALTSEELTQRT